MDVIPFKNSHNISKTSHHHALWYFLTAKSYSGLHFSGLDYIFPSKPLMPPLSHLNTFIITDLFSPYRIGKLETYWYFFALSYLKSIWLHFVSCYYLIRFYAFCQWNLYLRYFNLVTEFIDHGSCYSSYFLIY